MARSSIPRPPRRDQFRLMRRLLDTPQSALDELAGSFGPIVGLGAGPLRMVVIGSPPLIRELLMHPNDRFRWDTPLSPFPFVVGKHTMIASDGADHRRRRGPAQQAFGRRRLSRWIPMIVERVDAAVGELLASDGRLSADDLVPVDLYPVGRRLLIDIVVRALFGQRLVDRTTEIDTRFARSQQYLSSPLYRQVPHPLPFTLRAGVRRDRARLDAMIDTAIADSRAQPPPEGDEGDVLDALVHRSDLSDAEIRDQVKSLIGAGYDTTASSLAWMLWEATTRPDLWRRLREEADLVFGPVGDVCTATDETLASLELAHRTMRESLRLHPASGVGAREAAADVSVGEFEIGTGTVVLWSPYLAGRDAEAWADPERFDPDRFLDLDDAQRAIADEAWVPFGRGPRMCVGFALAQMELTLIIARLAQQLDIEPTAPRPPEPTGLIVSRPVGGAPMRVRARRQPLRSVEHAS